MAAKNISAAKRFGLGPKKDEGANQTVPETLTVSIDYAAKILGISRAAAYNYARDGSLPTIKIGGAKRQRFLVPKAALDRLLMTV